MAVTIDAPPGLEGVVVAETTIGDVRGGEGYFHYRGHSAAELARTASLEDVWHLIHTGHLPAAGERAPFFDRTARARAVPSHVIEVLPAFASVGTPMSALRTALSLAAQDAASWLDFAPGEREESALRLPAMAASLAAAISRVRAGMPPVAPDTSIGLAADYLRMTTGSVDARRAQALERYLILTIDHGFNASTFTSRVVASTGADLTAGVVAGIAALSGPLHGGAPSRVLEMLTEIGTAERARAWVERALAAGRRIMGFGHRVYRTEDPRSAVLKATALELGGPIVELAVEVEQIVLEILDAKYPERNLRTNVEFYAGVVLNEIGVPADMFPPTFAVSRTIGWTAHMLEQAAGNRIIRPASRYIGPIGV